MKNDRKSKPMRVVLLNSLGQKEDCGHAQTVTVQGKAGFKVDGFARVLYWSDKGKTWLPVEESK